MDQESIKRAFLVLVLGVFLSAGGIVYIILRVSPGGTFSLVLLALIGMFIHFSSTLIMYVLCRKRAFDSKRFILRRKFRNGAVLGLLVVALLALQRYFDVL